MNSTNELTSFDFINSFSDNNKDFVLSMIDVFLEQTPNELSNMEEALHNEDWIKLSKSAHTLVTSVKFMGIFTIVDDLKSIENNCKDGVNLDEVPDTFLKVKSTCIDAIEELELKKKVNDNFTNLNITSMTLKHEQFFAILVLLRSTM